MDCTSGFGGNAELTLFCDYLTTASTEFDEAVALQKLDSNQFFIIWASSLVIFMHAGFAMLSAGAIRGKNSKNIMLSIVMDMTVCAVGFFLIGFGFAYGTDLSGFIGTDKFAGWGYEADFSNWLFQFAFAATGATIVSGAIAERARFETYLLTSALMSVIVYPIAVHWVWGGGFLTLTKATSVMKTGVIDFAGCGPVHMVGGVAGLMGTIVMGPRKGRFDAATGLPVPMPGHNAPLAALGTFILWIGWLGFNGGSALSINNGNGSVAARACVNTVMSSAGGALGAMMTNWILTRDFDLTMCLNGVLAGLVSITGCCFCVEMWAGMCIGLIGGAIYVGSSRLMLKLKIDDPLDATPVHMFCGMWGIIAGAFFTNPLVLVGLFNADASDPYSYAETPAGIFYGGNTFMTTYGDSSTNLGGPIINGTELGAMKGALVANALTEIVTIFCWVTMITLPWFKFWHMLGLLRISDAMEEEGIDSSAHGGNAYPEQFYPGTKG